MFTKLGEIRRETGIRQCPCLQLTNDSTANRTPMTVATCNGSPAQRFVYAFVARSSP